MTEVSTIEVEIDGTAFTATLEDNDAARAFAAMLPLDLSMSELNGNEKYCYLDENLPQAASNPGTINAGDVMLFGAECLVLFYGTHSTSYSYTPIARMDDASGLLQAVGAGSVRVRWRA